MVTDVCAVVSLTLEMHDLTYPCLCHCILPLVQHSQGLKAGREGGREGGRREGGR